MTAYLVKHGGKYLHMDTKNGIFWGRKEGAFHLSSIDAAAQVPCDLTSDRARIVVIACEEEQLLPTLKSAVMVNIRSHTKTILEFPWMGIVRFYGSNSNGKSVLVKVLNDVVSNVITRPSDRRSIIRRGHEYGELMMTRYDDITLFIRITTGAAATYAELTRPDCPSVKRYLAGKSIPILVKEFGWYYDSDRGVSLSIHQDVDGFLFVNMRKSVNFDLLNSVRSDQYAEASSDSIEKLLKASKKQHTDIIHALEVAQATYAVLQYWDVEKETEVKDTCQYLARNLGALDVPPMPPIHPVPKVAIMPILREMPQLKYSKLLSPFTDKLPDIEKNIVELKETTSGVYPTCKRQLVDCAHE